MAAMVLPSAIKLAHLRFSLRTTLLLLTAACLILGLYVKHVRDQKAAREVVKAWGGIAYLDYQWAAASTSSKSPTKSPPTPPNFRRLRDQLGDDFFSDVVNVTVPYHSRADIDTSVLLTFRRLRSLDLSGTHIGNADLQKIVGMNQLEELRLADTDVTDDGIRWIAQLRGLKTLSLRGTVLSDAGLLALAQMNTLRELDITDTNATQQGSLRLQTALVNCRVNISLTATRKPLKW